MVWEMVRYPSGDAQAQVFWRRRMAVLGVAALVLLLLAVMLLRGGDPDPVTRTAAARPIATPTAELAALPPSASPAAAAPGATPTPTPTASATDRSTTCEPGSLALRITSDAASYPTGVQPTLTLSLVDVGSRLCVVDLGPTATSIKVLSNGKPAWTSSSCVDKTARPVNLTPSSSQELKLVWDRTGNAGGCSSPEALPAGQYELLANVGHAVVYGGAFTLS